MLIKYVVFLFIDMFEAFDFINACIDCCGNSGIHVARRCNACLTCGTNYKRSKRFDSPFRTIVLTSKLFYLLITREQLNRFGIGSHCYWLWEFRV